MLELYKERIDTYLAQLIPVDSPFHPSLYEAARYSLLAPGKRIRPLLTLCATEMLKKEVLERAIAPACALELIHTYSLIHDDLPCMDNDDFRRGLPTLHRMYNEGQAVLTGDYLLTFAFEVIATAPNLNAEQKVDLTRTMAQAAGGDGMIGGQVMDIECSSEISHMHQKKTAALFFAALTFAGIICQVSKKTMTLLQKFGLQFGLLFQLVDDLLDGDHPLGQAKAEEEAHHYLVEALKTLDEFSNNHASLKKLTEIVFAQHEKHNTHTTNCPI